MAKTPCPQCASLVEAPRPGSAFLCPACGYGTPAQAPPAEAAGGPRVVPNPTPPVAAPPTFSRDPYPATPPTARPTAKGAKASLVLGIVAYFTYILGFIPAILAIVFGSKAKRRIRESGGFLGGNGIATAGKVLGIIWLCLIPLFIIFAATVFVLVSDIGAPSEVSKVTTFSCASDLTAQGYQPYQDEVGDFGVCYPAAWETLHLAGIVVAFRSPPEAPDDGFQENFNLVREDLPLRMSVDRYTDASVEQLERQLTGVRVLSVDTRIFAGSSGRLIEYEFTADNGFAVHASAALIVDEKTGWVGTFSRPAGAPDSFVAERDNLFDSFRLVDS